MRGGLKRAALATSLHECQRVGERKKGKPSPRAVLQGVGLPFYSTVSWPASSNAGWNGGNPNRAGRGVSRKIVLRRSGCLR